VALLGFIALAGWQSTSYFFLSRERDVHEAVARAEELLKNGRPTLALQAVAGVADRGSPNPDLLTVQGLAFAALERPESARRPLERSLELNPRQPMAAKVLAAVYFYQEDYSRGLAMLNTAARLDERDFRPWYGAGDLFRRLDRPVEATKMFEESLRRRPDHYDSRVGLIWALLRSRGPESATRQLELALRDRPDDPEVQSLAARHALALGRAAEAMKHAQTCLAADPENLEALLLRAQVNRQAGLLEQARADAEHAVALAPNNLAALNLFAVLDAALGQRERAAATFARHRKLRECLEQIRHFREQIDARPSDPEPRWRIGQIAAEAGLTEEAVRSFKAALAVDPRCEVALQGLAKLGVSTDGSAPSGRSGPNPIGLGLSGP
jgi:tetratricopeptide (TPR) repeat protein